MKIVVVIDRLEGDFAVLDVQGVSVDWPRAALPAGVCEGARLEIGVTEIAGDDTAAKQRIERLKAKGPRGDIIDI